MIKTEQSNILTLSWNKYKDILKADIVCEEFTCILQQRGVNFKALR